MAPRGKRDSHRTSGPPRRGRSATRNTARQPDHQATPTMELLPGQSELGERTVATARAVDAHPNAGGTDVPLSVGNLATNASESAGLLNIAVRNLASSGTTETAFVTASPTRIAAVASASSTGAGPEESLPRVLPPFVGSTGEHFVCETRTDNANANRLCSPCQKPSGQSVRHSRCD